ncbi:MAG: hypothetical protein MI864_14485 [Pseudomonadales bacterium]|nr:hypothetical protein [Oleiphilus messinensis]MCG8611731.1 hypothetical protein [Pseudomonadales bacterium]
MARKFLVRMASFLFISQAYAADVLEIEGISVKGNDEQPKVLFIVPWGANVKSQEISHPPSTALVDGGLVDGEQALGFIEPELFRKQLKYHQDNGVTVPALPDNE